MTNSHIPTSRSHSLAKGLATLALLKANFDSGIDHLDMLLPFVADCILCHPSEDFSAEDIRASLHNRYGLQIPSTSMQLILTRAIRRKLISRQGGRYFREEATRSTVPDIQNRSEEIQAEHSFIAQALIDYASQENLVISTQEDALAMIFEFISQFHVQLLLEPPFEDGSAPILLDQLRGLGSKETRIVARFLLSNCLTNPKLQPAVRRILEGYVLQNALLLKDITSAKNRFSNLTVYFDTAFLLDALGLAGDAARLAARESLDLLRTTNASIAVFDATIKEIKRILFVYERHLATTKGIETLRPTPITRYLLSRHFSPSDIREESALLESHIQALGFKIVPIPDHIPQFTLGEADLTRRLSRPDQPDVEPRVIHDVDCIAAILTMRAGRRPQSYDSAKAVFATTSGLLLKTVKEWFRAQGEAGVFPSIHCLALSSIAWLKKPAAVTDLKLNELIALCSAALAPSSRTWELFIKHLQKLREDNRLTDDEMVAVIASELSDNLLSEFDEEVEPDATTLTEIVNRVKSAYKSEASATIEKVKQDASEQVAATQVEKTEIEQQLRRSEHQHHTLVLQLRGRAASIARTCGLIFFFITAATLVIGPLFLALIPTTGSVLFKSLTYGIAAITWLASVIGLLWGGYVKQWQKSFEIAIEKKLRNWFGVEE